MARLLYILSRFLGYEVLLLKGGDGIDCKSLPEFIKKMFCDKKDSLYKFFISGFVYALSLV